MSSPEMFGALLLLLLAAFVLGYLTCRWTEAKQDGGSLKQDVEYWRTRNARFIPPEVKPVVRRVKNVILISDYKRVTKPQTEVT